MSTYSMNSGINTQMALTLKQNQDANPGLLVAIDLMQERIQAGIELGHRDPAGLAKNLYWNRWHHHGRTTWGTYSKEHHLCMLIGSVIESVLDDDARENLHQELMTTVHS